MTERYTIKRKLGEGASATVLLATDELTGQQVAIKRALDIMARHARFAGRWQREVIVLQTLQHARIVPLIDATFSKGKPLTMVMAFASEGDLEGKLQNGCTFKQALGWLYETLEGLAHIHSFGVIHQDIKPDNILIGPDNNAWLADFSIARTRAELLINPQDVTGTPEWYAPEQQLRLASEVGPWTDLFAWGKILELVITSMSYRSGELAYIVEGCTTLDPQQRFRTSAELLPLLKEAINGLPTSVLQRKFKVKHRRGMGALLKEGFSFPPGFVPISRKGLAQSDFSPVEPFVPSASPALLSVVSRFRSRSDTLAQLWDAAKWVKDNQQSKVLFVKGPKGSGRKDIIRHFVRELNKAGVMDSLILSYHENGSFDDGYRGAVQHLLSPWGENRENFIARLQRWLAREKQVPIRSTRREATGLAKWCGFLESEEQAVDNGLGLIFLFQHLQHLSWKGGAVVVLEDPKYCTINGDGLDICETLLGSDFSKRPVLVLTTIPEDMSTTTSSFQHKVQVLKMMGAEELSISAWSDQEVLSHIDAVCQVPSALHSDIVGFCAGQIHRANLFVQNLALQGDMTWSKEADSFVMNADARVELDDRFFEQYFVRLFATVPQPELATDVLAAMVCSAEPVEQMILNEISSVGLQELIQVGLLRQQERSIRFAYPELKEVVTIWVTEQVSLPRIHKRIAEAWMELVARWGLRLDLQIGQAWLQAGEPEKALPFLLLAIQDARHAWLLERTEYIADLIAAAATKTNSHMGLLEGRLNRLEVRIKRGKLKGIQALALEVEQMGQLDPQSVGRLALIHADYLVQLKKWLPANQYLRQALEHFSQNSDRKGRAQTFLKQGQLLLVLNRLEGAADRFAQASMISPKISVEWVEAQARLIEIRLRLGWVTGLPAQIDGIWRQTQNNADIHHMAYATYIAGLLFVYQLRLKEGLVRLQTTQTLASSCGDSELRGQSLESQGALYFLDGNWAEVCRVQKQLIFHYQMRAMRDRRRVSMLRLRCAYALDPDTQSDSIWKVEIQDLKNAFVHVQYWWWMLQLLNPKNTPTEIETYWAQADKVSEPQIWDISLFRILFTMQSSEAFLCIREAVAEEVQKRFAKQYKHFSKITL